MAIYFSASKVAFYSTDIYSDDEMPSDKVEVSDAEYAELMKKQNNGEVIVAGTGGKPTTMSQSCGACDCLVHEKTVASATVLGHVKLDSTPKSGSNNAVTSHGVYNELAKKAVDTDALHKAGQETITGEKTIAQDAPRLRMKFNTLATTDTPANNTSALIIANDKNYKAVGLFGVEKQSGGDTITTIQICDTSGKAAGGISVRRNTNGQIFTSAPTPNDALGNQQIATVGWTNTKLAGKANSSHNHTIDNVTGLQKQLDKGFQNTCVEISNGTDISAYKFVAILNNDGFVSFSPTCLVVATGKICNWISDDWGEFNAGSYSYDKSTHKFSGTNGGGISKIYGIN